MAQIKIENVVGLVRPEVRKGDKNRDKPYTVVERVGTDPRTGKEITARREIDRDTAKTLEKRLDKERSKMERDGSRSREREPERREPSRVASEADRRAFLSRFSKPGG